MHNCLLLTGVIQSPKHLSVVEHIDDGTDDKGCIDNLAIRLAMEVGEQR